MYKNHKIFFLIPAYDEELKIGKVLQRLPGGIADHVVVVDDGSTDRTAQVARENGALVISLDDCMGVGYAIRRGYDEARAVGADIVVTIAGNNKDNPDEITRLLDPICDQAMDFVMGSRFLAGGGYGGDMPGYRKFATRLHPWLVGLFTRKKITESTNGFRAIKTDVFQDERINLHQDWLDQYELEVYLLMKLFMLGYRTTEVPCSKIYPSKKIGNTKMRPIVDWWRMLRPIFLIGLRLRV